MFLLCRVMPVVRWPMWFVMPCYAMVGWKSLISGDFPSDQGTNPEQQGTIWDKERRSRVYPGRTTLEWGEMRRWPISCERVMSVQKGYPDMSWFDQGIPC